MTNDRGKLTYRICLILVFLILGGSTFFIFSGQKKNIYFEHISAKQGLPQSTIQCMMQDEKGFIWIGTEEGLSKYDGYDFVTYKPDPDNPNSLSYNFIRDIIQNHEGDLWIVTYGGGLNKFDYVAESFTRYCVNNSKNNSIISDQMVTLVEDRSGYLWIGYFGDGVSKFDPKTEQSFHYTNDPSNPKSLSNNNLRIIYQDRKGGLWFGTYGGGLDKYDPENDSFIHFKNRPGDDTSLSYNQILTIFEDSDGFLWIGTYGGGLNKFDPKTGIFKRYLHDPHNPNSLCDDEVWAICQDEEGLLWIGTAGGLNIFDPASGSFQHYKSDPTYPFSLSTNEIRTILKDNTGAIWFGTALGGINRYCKEKQRFRIYRNNPSHPHSLSNNKVLSIYKDRANNFWIGTYEGLNKWDRKNNRYKVYKNNPDKSHTISSDPVMALYEDRSGVFWVGTLGGLNIFNRDAETFERYVLDTNDINSLNDRIVCICEDQKGYLWVGSTNGLNKVDRKNKTYVRYRNDTADPNSISNSMILSAFLDRYGVLWIGTWGGLNTFNHDTETFTRYKADENNPDSLSHNKVNYFFEDHEGMLWIGTDGGLNRYQRETGTFVSFDTKDGLPNNVIYGILEDEQGNLWLSTNKGLSRFNPHKKEFKNFDARDGLQSNEFLYASCYRDDNGEMFFGGINGFNSFFPNSFKDNPIKPVLVITDIKVFNKSVKVGEALDGVTILKKHIAKADEINLSWKHSAFTISYAALHYAIPEKNQYSFMMENLEKKWNSVGELRFATYAHLPPGSYLFKVKASNCDGIWNKSGTSIRIKIQPPPWRTWWAYTLYSILFIGIIAFYIRSQKKKLAYERSVNERLRQVDRLKDEFLANTSHELRTPLHGIIGIAESLIRGATGHLPNPTISNLKMVVLSGKRLNNLVNDILDYSRLKENDLQLQMKAVDMKSLTEVVLLMSSPLVAAKPVALNNNIPNDLPLVYGDENRLQQIMHNIVGNAIKFTYSGTVSVTAVKMGAENRVKILIQDTGIGIPRDKLEAIFQSFEQADTSTSREYGGTGLGLSITKKLVELHDGSIGVESEEGKGSTFWFTLPIWKGHLQTTPSPDTGEKPSPQETPAQSTSIIHEQPITKADTAPVPVGKYRILAVDDEIINLQVLVNHLSIKGYSVSKAMNGEEALQFIGNPAKKADIVLLDVMMPRMSGYEVCRRIREYYSPSELPVIMLTAKTQLENLVEGLNSGANDYITKPFSSEELVERIRVHLQLLNANRELKDANEKLEDYSRTLEQKVTERTKDLREKNQLIMASMHFAQRIQQSILPFQERLNAVFPEYFVIYKPKDIVSGDFYWFEQVGDKIFIAVVDCTGHGVPGALMTMIGSTILNKLVQEHRVYKPSLILEYLHRDVKKALKQKQIGIRHIDTAGMDVCLCMIDKNSEKIGRKVTFAGAHQPLYIIKTDEGNNLLEIKGDRKPIGGLQAKKDSERKYTQKEIILKNGDMIYLTSDGFVHQSNHKDKKYGRSKLKRYFQEIAPLPAHKQEQKLLAELANHMGNEEQRDDITVMGVRIP